MIFILISLDNPAAFSLHWFFYSFFLLFRVRLFMAFGRWIGWREEVFRVCLYSTQSERLPVFIVCALHNNIKNGKNEKKLFSLCAWLRSPLFHLFLFLFLIFFCILFSLMIPLTMMILPTPPTHEEKKWNKFFSSFHFHFVISPPKIYSLLCSFFSWLFLWRHDEEWKSFVVNLMSDEVERI
jgi:hypothetical protein